MPCLMPASFCVPCRLQPEQDACMLYAAKYASHACNILRPLSLAARKRCMHAVCCLLQSTRHRHANIMCALSLAARTRCMHAECCMLQSTRHRHATLCVPSHLQPDKDTCMLHAAKHASQACNMIAPSHLQPEEDACALHAVRCKACVTGMRVTGMQHYVRPLTCSQSEMHACCMLQSLCHMLPSFCASYHLQPEQDACMLYAAKYASGPTDLIIAGGSGKRPCVKAFQTVGSGAGFNISKGKCLKQDDTLANV